VSNQDLKFLFVSFIPAARALAAPPPRLASPRLRLAIL